MPGFRRILAEGKSYDELSVDIREKSKTLPKHHANLYYNGEVGKVGIDFNMDYMWQKSTSELTNNEVSGNFDNTLVTSATTNRSRLFAEKLVFSYPVWKGGIEFVD